MKRIALVAVVAISVCSQVFAAKETSGELEKPGSQKGRIAFVNKQTRLSEVDINKSIAHIAKETRCKVELGSAEGAQVVIEIVDNPTESGLVAYPEEYRAIVNIAKLEAGLKGSAKDKFFIPRCRKELLRAFCFACGCAGTEFPGNILAITKIQDLDLVEEFIPGDTVYACQKRLNALGVTQKIVVSYGRACREGWAPAPTNDVQKRIWNRIHAIPKNPMKIEFDPKKGR